MTVSTAPENEDNPPYADRQQGALAVLLEFSRPVPARSGRHREQKKPHPLIALPAAFGGAAWSVLIRPHLSRFTWFCLVGAVVFAAGTAMQYYLIRDGMGSEPSYLLQTIMSVELGYVLNRLGPFRDRHAAFWPSLFRWHAQRVVTITLNVLFFDALVRYAGMGWLEANVVATAVFVPVNYLTAYLWVFARRRRTAALAGVRVSVPGTVAAALLCTIPAGFLLVHALVGVVYAAMLLPCAELVLLTGGLLWHRFRFRRGAAVSALIVQITTAGFEPDRVSEIISEIRGYGTVRGLVPEIWVVTEPRDSTRYAADRTLRVPAEFTCRARRKCRAHEYARCVRSLMGLGRPDVKIVFCDDDVTLTKAYLETAADADYDVCEGIIAPRTHYAARPLSHFLASHADDIRTHACLVYCSVFQGVFGKPLHVHGEGLVVTGAAEQEVGWDFDVVASEDLAFGQRAAQLGLRWGWFRQYAEVTSPWTLTEWLAVQRHRWLFGDLWLLRRRSEMSLAGAARVAVKYGFGIVGLSASIAGLVMRFDGQIPATAGVLNFAKLGLLAWAGLAFACGWIGAGAARGPDSRLLSGVLAVLLMPVSALLTFAAILVPLAMGDNKDFALVRKTRSS